MIASRRIEEMSEYITGLIVLTADELKKLPVAQLVKVIKELSPGQLQALEAKLNEDMATLEEKNNKVSKGVDNKVGFWVIAIRDLALVAGIAAVCAICFGCPPAGIVVTACAFFVVGSVIHYMYQDKVSERKREKESVQQKLNEVIGEKNNRVEQENNRVEQENNRVEQENNRVKQESARRQEVPAAELMPPRSSLTSPLTPDRPNLRQHDAITTKDSQRSLGNNCNNST